MPWLLEDIGIECVGVRERAALRELEGLPDLDKHLLFDGAAGRRGQLLARALHRIEAKPRLRLLPRPVSGVEIFARPDVLPPAIDRTFQESRTGRARPHRVDGVLRRVV